MSEHPWQVVVIGAGAAGLMAALRAAERGRRALLLEKNRKAGVKILMSGGTRCNITHNTDNRGIVAAYGPSGKFLHSALAAFSVQDTLDFFAAEGVATKVEDTGKIFPVSDKAADVLNALLRRLVRSGAILALEEPVLEMSLARLAGSDAAAAEATASVAGPLRQAGPSFLIMTPRRRILAERVILTSGGQSYPGAGTTGDGYRFAAQFGHTIIPPRPALVPLTTAASWAHELRGLTLPDVAVSIWENQAKLAARRGSLLFAHFGLSGPVILDVSRVVSGHPRPQDLTLEIDLLPAISESEVADWLRQAALASGKKQLAVVLAERLPRRLADTVLDQAGSDRERKAAALAKDDRARIVSAIKRLRLALSGTLGFKKAEVTAGGIALAEVDSRNMQSKLVPNLFLAGEILDLDGPIGGYNFQAAWSTGWLAGSCV